MSLVCVLFLSIFYSFERFQSCAYGRRCVYAHGDDEHARWSVIEERRQKTQLVPELLSQRLREAFLRENYFVVSGCVSSHMGRSFYDLPLCSCLRLKVAMHWTSCGIRAKGGLLSTRRRSRLFLFYSTAKSTAKLHSKRKR